MAVNYRGKKFYNIGPRWLYGVSDMFYNFYFKKITKLLTTQQPLKLEKKGADL